MPGCSPRWTVQRDCSLPNRVVISTGPLHAVCLKRARWAGTWYDTIFVREDGWAIACKKEWRGPTYLLYPDRWEAVITLPDQRVRRLNQRRRAGQ